MAFELPSDVLVWVDVAWSRLTFGHAPRRPMRDMRVGREDRAKQQWLLLTAKLWYPNLRSLSVAA